MKRIFLIIALAFMCKASNAQMIKSFDCVKSYEDSSITVYSVRIGLDRRVHNDSGLNIVKTEFKKRFQIQSDKILQIDRLGSKKYNTYQCLVRVEK